MITVGRTLPGRVGHPISPCRNAGAGIGANSTSTISADVSFCALLTTKKRNAMSMSACKKCGVEDDVHECNLCESSFCGGCNVSSGWLPLDPECSYGLYGCFLCKPDFESAKAANLKCVENGWVHKKNWLGEEEELDKSGIKEAMKKLERHTRQAEEVGLHQEKKAGDKVSQISPEDKRTKPFIYE